MKMCKWRSPCPVRPILHSYDGFKTVQSVSGRVIPIIHQPMISMPSNTGCPCCRLASQLVAGGMVGTWQQLPGRVQQICWEAAVQGGSYYHTRDLHDMDQEGNTGAFASKTMTHIVYSFVFIICGFPANQTLLTRVTLIFWHRTLPSGSDQKIPTKRRTLWNLKSYTGK